MEKLYIYEIIFEVKETEQEKFKQLIIKFKNDLIAKNISSYAFDLLHNVGENKESWQLFVMFKNNEEYHLWHKAAGEAMDKEFWAELDIYFKSHSYWENVTL